MVLKTCSYKIRKRTKSLTSNKLELREYSSKEKIFNSRLLALYVINVNFVTF